MVHKIASFSGTYLTVPMLACSVYTKRTGEKRRNKRRRVQTLNLGESASGGTGMKMFTLFAVDRCLNCDLACVQREKQNRVGTTD
jgi:hypothetical protein